jgi:hypothetical protein
LKAGCCNIVRICTSLLEATSRVDGVVTEGHVLCDSDKSRSVELLLSRLVPSHSIGHGACRQPASDSAVGIRAGDVLAVWGVGDAPVPLGDRVYLKELLCASVIASNFCSRVAHPQFPRKRSTSKGFIHFTVLNARNPIGGETPDDAIGYDYISSDANDRALYRVNTSSDVFAVDGGITRNHADSECDLIAIRVLSDLWRLQQDGVSSP